MQIITYGLGGACIECSADHDHPLNNIVSIIDIEEEGAL